MFSVTALFHSYIYVKMYPFDMILWLQLILMLGSFSTLFTGHFKMLLPIKVVLVSCVYQTRHPRQYF